MSDTSRGIARNHPVATIVLAGATVYAGYWGIQQVHWLVSHMFTVMLIAAMIAGVTMVTRKVRGAIRATPESAPTDEDIVRNWTAPVAGLPAAPVVDMAAYDALMRAARTRNAG